MEIEDKKYPDDYGYWKVNLLCYIPTSDDGSQLELIKKHIEENPKFAIGYVNNVEIEYIDKNL